jgi:hypothetical protein
VLADLEVLFLAGHPGGLGEGLLETPGGFEIADLAALGAHKMVMVPGQVFC